MDRVNQSGQGDLDPGREQGGGWGINVPGRVGGGKTKPRDRKSSDHFGNVEETNVLKTYSNDLITCHSPWLRLEVLWGQESYFLLPLELLVWGEFYMGRACSVSCIDLLVRFSPHLQLFSFEILYVLKLILWPLPGKMDCIPSQSVLPTPPGGQREKKREIMVIFARINNCQYFFPM